MARSSLVLTRRMALVAAGAGGAMSLMARPAKAAPAGRQATLEQAVDALRVAMVAGDGAALNRLLDDRLTYMHSSGHSQTKANLLNDLAGKQFFASLTYTESKIDLIDNTGIATVTVDQVKNLPGGKTRASRIKILQTWVRTGGEWKLAARVSALITSPLKPTCAPAVPAGQSRSGE